MRIINDDRNSNRNSGGNNSGYNRGVAGGNRELSQRERLSYGIERLTRSDIGMTRTQAIGALGSMAGESGAGFKTDAHNPNDPNGGSYGIAQWHSERLDGLKSKAKDSKYGLNDFRTQMDYVADELKTTHKHVLNSMKKATTLADATKTWTNKFEVPNQKYAHHDRRLSLSKQFASLTSKGPKSPQAAIDAASSTMNGIAGLGSLTGATNVEPEYVEDEAPANATTKTGYVAEDGTSVTRQLERQAQQGRTPGLFEQMFTGMAGAVAGATADLSQKTNAVSNKLGLGDVVDGKQVESGGIALDDTGDKMNPTSEKDGFFGDANFGGMTGSLLGGYFAGPVGAVVGGLAGQGITRALTKVSTAAQTEADAKETAGIAGGVGRAMDSLFGGFGLVQKIAANQNQDQNEFPDRPQGSRGDTGNYGQSGLNEQGRNAYGSSGQFRDAVDSGKGGLW